MASEHRNCGPQHPGAGRFLRQVAAELTRRGIIALRRGDWSAVQVKRVLTRVNNVVENH